MWGTKKGLWITSYLGYLQQHYDIVFYDCQELANINLTVENQENLKAAFVEGGINTAVQHLLKREKIVSHYLAFSTGGTIVYKAGLLGLPIKSLYAVSPTRIRLESQTPDFPNTLLFGGNDKNKPDAIWEKETKNKLSLVPNFGHELYSDEKIVKQICKELLSKVTKKQFQD